MRRIAVAGTGVSAAFWGWGLYVWLTSASAASVMVAMATAVGMLVVTAVLWQVIIFGRAVRIFQLGAETMYAAMCDQRDAGATVTPLMRDTAAH